MKSIAAGLWGSVVALGGGAVGFAMGWFGVPVIILAALTAYLSILSIIEGIQELRGD